MIVLKELKDKINFLFQNDVKLRNRLLQGDVDAIGQIGLISRKGISPEFVIESYEKKQDKALEYIYMEAKRVIELQKLYIELCQLCYENTDNLKNKRR